MSIFSGFDRANIPTLAAVRHVNISPQTDMVVNNAIQQSVQEFPPAINTGAFFAQLVRGPLLPPYGTKDRDYTLRIMYRNEYNNLVQAVVTALQKKFLTIPFVLHGDVKDVVILQNEYGRSYTMGAVEYYQNILQNEEFGFGYVNCTSKLLEDFLTQDFGGILEKIGPGDPTGPIPTKVVKMYGRTTILNPLTGISHLDAGRAWITGNPYFPIMYFSLISGSLHRMHASRIVRFVDSPSPDERYFNIGLCALSRTVAVASRQQFMNRYIEGMVDDRPQPGILSVTNMTKKQFDALAAQYLREQSNDTPGPFGKTLIVTGTDVDKEVKVNHMPFSTTPEKFDWVKYTELDVHALAAGFNIDVQEIWELTGRQGMGSTAQSQVLHQKSEAKMQGFLMKLVEGEYNLHILPPNIQLELRYNDPVQKENEATIDGQIATTAANLVTAQLGTPLELRTYLTLNSDRFKDAFTDTPDQVLGEDASNQVGVDNTVVEDMSDPVQPQLSIGSDAPAEQPMLPRSTPSPAKPKVARQPVPGRSVGASQPRPTARVAAAPPMLKGFSITSQDFERTFTKALVMGVDGQLDRQAFEDALLDMLTAGAVKAYVNGLKAGGYTAALDTEQQQVIHNFLVGQIDYIDNLGQQLEAGRFQPAQPIVKAVTVDGKFATSRKGLGDVVGFIRQKAEMWVTKSLKRMFEAGRLFADPEGLYAFAGDDGVESCPTCQRLKGQVHALVDWHAASLVPGVDTDAYDCGGYNCQHDLVRTDAPAWGEF